MEIRDGKEYIPQVRELIAEYTERLGRNLSFQHLDEELQNPAFKYTPPQGEIFVAVENGNVIGMVAYHRHNEDRCEMKRLYLKPETRGMHIGDALVQKITAAAKEAGYKEMVLGTIKPLTAAIHLYKKHGFSECAPYYDNPMQDVLYMRKDL